MGACLLLVCAVAAYGAGGGVERLANSIARNGAEIQIPENLSRVLGIGRAGQKTPAKQASLRDGHLIETFNVCRDDPNQVVILTYDEPSRMTKAYLMAADGSLKKAVAYVAGGAPEVRTTAQARADFDAAVAFWRRFRPPGA